MSSLKSSKIKLTNAEIKLVVRMLDGFQSSGWAGLKDLVDKDAHCQRHGMRFEVLTAFAQSAVLDGMFDPSEGKTSQQQYAEALETLTHIFKGYARVYYRIEGNDFSVRLSYTPMKAEEVPPNRMLKSS